MPKIFCCFWRGLGAWEGGVAKYWWGNFEKNLCDPELVVYNFGGFLLLRAAMEGWARSKNIILNILYIKTEIEWDTSALGLCR
jgi:hypothetical protein